MSYVTNLILIADCEDEAESIVKLSSFIRDHGSWFENVVDHAGGNKFFESDVLMAAVNGLNYDEFLEEFNRLDWRYPQYVQLFVRQQGDETFTVFVPKSEQLANRDIEL